MREILFRGKRIDNGEWIEGAFCPKNCYDLFGSMVDKPSIIKLEPPCDGFWFEVDPATVGQYTGLTDKNGKKIFEEDIVTAEGCVYVCQWNDGNLEIELANNVEHFSMCYVYPNVEVIGNIHDDPELLKGK